MAEKRIYTGIPTDLTPVSPQKLAEMMGITKATICNWLRDGKEIAGVQKVERMGNRWIIYVCGKSVCG